MEDGAEKPKPYRYKRALERMAEDVRGQYALEKYQDETGVSVAMIDRVRAKSYKRLALEIEKTLGVELGIEDHKYQFRASPGPNNIRTSKKRKPATVSKRS